MFAYVKYTRRKSWAPDAFSLSVMIGLAAAYFLAALLGLRLQIPGTNASPVWPPTGIALAGLLIFGRRAWVGVAVGAFAANFVTLPQELALNLKIGTSATISIGNTLEAIVAFWLISRSQNTIYLERASDVFRYFVAISVACLLSATIGTACVCAWVIGNWSPFADIWTTWWLGDVAGGIVVGAFVLVWAEFFRQSAKLEKARETSLLLLGVAFATHAIFSAMTGSLLDSLPYLLFAGPLWSASRLGLRQTITVIFVISAISVLHTVDGSGPFFHPAPGSPLCVRVC